MRLYSLVLYLFIVVSFVIRSYWLFYRFFSAYNNIVLFLQVRTIIGFCVKPLIVFERVKTIDATNKTIFKSNHITNIYVASVFE